MSVEDVEIVRRVYDAVARRAAATVLALYDPGVELDTTRAAVGDLMGRSVYRGHEGLRSWFRQWHEAWGDVETSCEELIDAGDSVVVSVARYRARGRASGARVEGPAQYGVWTVREGKIVRVVWFSTRAEALEAAGLGH